MHEWRSRLYASHCSIRFYCNLCAEKNMYPLAPFTSPCHMRMIHKTIATTGQRNNNKNVSRTAQVSYTCQIITVDMWIDYGERLCDVRSNSVFRYFIFVFLVLCYTLVKLHKSYVFMGQAQCFASSLTLTLCGVDCEWYYTVGHSRTHCCFAILLEYIHNVEIELRITGFSHSRHFATAITVGSANYVVPRS